MNVFFKAVAVVLTAIILWLVLNKETKEVSALLTIAVCTVVISASIGFLKPVISFIYHVRDMANLDEELISVILRVVGIGMLTEISAVICKDAGNDAMGKSLHILCVIVVIWMSIPVFEKLLLLLDNVLNTV